MRSLSTLGLLRARRSVTPQHGITLIELMIVVVIIGVLASVAVVYFGGTEKKTKARAEVVAIFAEFTVRQEQSMMENRTYLSTAGNNEATTWPSAPSSTGGKQTLLPLPAEWTALHMAPGESAVYCAYTAVIGEASDATNVGTVAASDFAFTPPAKNWYYLLARCDMDQNSAVDSYYFRSSTAAELSYINNGR